MVIKSTKLWGLRGGRRPGMTKRAAWRPRNNIMRNDAAGAPQQPPKGASRAQRAESAVVSADCNEARVAGWRGLRRGGRRGFEQGIRGGRVAMVRRLFYVKTRNLFVFSPYNIWCSWRLAASVRDIVRNARPGNQAGARRERARPRQVARTGRGTAAHGSHRTNQTRHAAQGIQKNPES